MPFAPISLRFTDADRMAIDDEPSYYVHEHAGNVVLIEVDEDIVETPIGRFERYIAALEKKSKPGKSRFA